MNGAAIELLELLVVGNLRVIALLLIVAGLLSVCGRRLSAPTRRNVWRVTLAGCLAIPVFGALLPDLALPVLPAAEPAPMIAAQAVGDAVAPSPTRKSSIPATELFLLAYLAGVALVAARHGRSLLELRRFVRTTVPWSDLVALELLQQLRAQFGMERKLELRSSRDVTSALSWGWLTTRIVLPDEAAVWGNDRLRNVLVHEIGHGLHRDWLWLHAGKLIGAIYWLNPAVALAIRQHELEMEKACDECVLSSGGNSVDYAEHLLELMSAPDRGLRAGIALGQAHFRRRIRAILDFSKERRTMSNVNAQVVVAVAVASILALSAIELTSAQPAAEGQSGQPEVAPGPASTESERFTALKQESRRLENEFNILDQALYNAFMRTRLDDRAGDGDAAGLDERYKRAKADLSAFMEALEKSSPAQPDRAEFLRQLDTRTDLSPEERSQERYNFELRAVVESKRAALEKLEAPLPQRPE